MDPVRIVGIAGSLNPDSKTALAVQGALAGAALSGAETHFLDLRELEVPVMVETHGDKPGDVDAMNRTVCDAHGLILGTPEYHGSYSGVLKNALDWMGFDEFEGKVVGLVAVSGGALGGVSAMEALRTVSRALHAWVVPSQCGIPRSWEAFGDDGKPKEESNSKRLAGVGAEVARFAALHNSDDAKSFLRAWEAARENPGA